MILHKNHEKFKFCLVDNCFMLSREKLFFNAKEAAGQKTFLKICDLCKIQGQKYDNINLRSCLHLHWQAMETHCCIKHKNLQGMKAMKNTFLITFTCEGRVHGEQLAY